jgi:hypothetical protein
MNSYEDRELVRELQDLASQIPVPANRLPTRAGGPLGRVVTVAGAVVVLVAAVAVGAAINNLRSEKDNSGAAPSATPTVASPSPSPSAAIPFPDYALIAGTSNGFVYRIEAGQVRGSAVDVCHGQTVLAIHLSATARSLLVICGGNPQGQAIVLDAATLAQRAAAIPVLPRSDVGAWAPDERSVALLQEGVCDPQAPVCSVHVVLWDLTNGSTRVIRPDQALTHNIQWTALGLSISLSQSPPDGTLIWDGRNWNHYSSHALWIADAGGRALLVEAATGNSGGRVWEAIGGQEVALNTSGTEYPLGLDGERAIVWRETPLTNSGAFVVYRGQREERQVSAELCLAAQQIDRWLLCTNSGSAALAYSLDANAFARQPINGLNRFNVLVAVPKNSQGATPTAPAKAVETPASATASQGWSLVRESMPSYTAVLRPSWLPDRYAADRVVVEYAHNVNGWRYRVGYGAGNSSVLFALGSVNSARPTSTETLTLRGISVTISTAADFPAIQAIWDESGGTYTIQSNDLSRDELIRVIDSLQPIGGT